MNRSTPHRGLLAGLLALVVFASGAVALAAHGTPGATGAGAQSATTAAASAATGDRDRDGDRFGDGDGARGRRQSLVGRGGRGR
jgi:hypothetical protein